VEIRLSSVYFQFHYFIFRSPRRSIRRAAAAIMGGDFGENSARQGKMAKLQIAPTGA